MKTTVQNWTYEMDGFHEKKIVFLNLLLFGRSCLIVGHHRLTDKFFPAAAAARTHCDVIFVQCLYCFHDLPLLPLPSAYP